MVLPNIGSFFVFKWVFLVVLVQVGKRFHSLGTKIGLDRVLFMINIEIAIYQQQQRSEGY